MKTYLLYVWFLVVLGVVTAVYPGLFSSKVYEIPNKKTKLIWKPTQLRISQQAGEKVFSNYRGEERQGVFHISKFPSDLRLKWSTERINVGIHGASKASPISDGKQVYIGGDTSWFSVFDLFGNKRWKFYLGDSSRGIHSTASLDSLAAYVGSYRGAVYKIRKETGELLWSRIVGQTIGASPLLDSTGLILAVETFSGRPDGYLIKLDAQTGETIWQSENLGEQAHSSPALDPETGYVVLGVNNSTIQAFDSKDGKRVWSIEVAGPVKSTAALNKGIGAISTWGKELAAFEIKTGKILWKSSLSVKSQVSPVHLKSGNQFVVADASGKIFSFASDTGKLLWKLDQAYEDQRSSPVVLTDRKREKILFMCVKDTLCLISENGKIEKKWSIPGRFTGVPFIQGDLILLSLNDGELVAYEMK